MNNSIIKTTILLCALLIAPFSSALLQEKEIHVTVTTADASDAETTTKTLSYTTDGDGNIEVDSEVSQAVDEVVKELKQEWQNLDEQERQEVKDAIRSIGDGISVNFDPDMDFGSMIVAIFAILFTFGSPILIVALVLYSSHRKRKQRAALIEKFLEAGKDVPEEVLASYSETGAAGNNLQRGLILCGIGLGLILCFGFLADWSVGAIGLIPLCIGLARLLIWKLDQKNAENDAANTDPAA